MNKKYLLNQHILNIGLLTLVYLTFAFSNELFAKEVDPKLSKLRHQFALNYLSPESHFALAQYYLEKGNKIQAFYIMEYARRIRFSRKEFDAAYLKYFGENTLEPSTEAKVHFNEAYCLIEEKKYEKAEKELIKAAEMAPKSAMIQSWVGSFYFNTKKDNTKALEYYYNAYFLDPHAYSNEYAEFRIYQITNRKADAQFNKLVKSGKSLTEISDSENPLIIIRAIGKMGDNWKSEYSKTLLDQMENDDSIVRWAAFQTLHKKLGKPSNKLISKLLNDKDLRKKGLAAYAIAERGEEADFKILKSMLNDKSDLIRFDSISALALKEGNVGQEILIKHRESEKHPYLRNLIDKNLRGN